MAPGIKTLLFTLLAATAVYFVGNGRVQLWDRDEPRYAQCSRQMLESGDWVVPRLYDSLRTKKPPLIYWCQATAMKFLGRSGDSESFAFAARVPSVVAMLGTLIVLSVVLWRHSGPAQAAWTVFIFATSGLAIVAAKICLTDSVLILFITVAQLCAFAIWRGNRSWSLAILLAVMFGLGALIKGPFIVGIVGCTALALGVFFLVDRWIEKRRGHSFAPTVGGEGAAFSPGGRAGSAERGHDPAWPPGLNLPRTLAQVLVILLIVTAIFAPWAMLVHHRAPEFLSAMTLEARQHAVIGKEGHHFPPGYHLLLVWPMFMPWSLLLPLAIGMGFRHRRIPEVRFALAAVLGPWLMVEFMGTKLPHYFLPAYPALAFLVAFAIRRCMRGDSKNDEGKNLESRSFRIGAAVWAIAVAAVGAAPWLAAGSFKLPWVGNIGTTFSPLPRGAMIGLSATSLLLGAAALVLLYTRRFAAAFVTMGVGMFAVITLAWALYFPQADFLRVSIHTAAFLKARGAIHPGDVKMVDYKEPSLGFYQGGTIREVEKKSELLSRPLCEWPRWVVITREAWEMVPPHFKAPDDAGFQGAAIDIPANSANVLSNPVSQMPWWALMTREVWETLQPAGRERLRVIDSCRGWAYADQGRVVEVLVIEKSVY